MIKKRTRHSAFFSLITSSLAFQSQKTPACFFSSSSATLIMLKLLISGVPSTEHKKRKKKGKQERSRLGEEKQMKFDTKQIQERREKMMFSGECCLLHFEFVV
jgi:hypothetical protein